MTFGDAQVESARGEKTEGVPGARPEMEATMRSLTSATLGETRHDDEQDLSKNER